MDVRGARTSRVREDKQLVNCESRRVCRRRRESQSTLSPLTTITI